MTWMTMRQRLKAGAIGLAAALLCACGGSQSGAAADAAGSAPTVAQPATAKPVNSGGNSSDTLRHDTIAALHGKTIAWVPAALGLSLTDIWTQVMREDAHAHGMKFIVRDPNWSASAGLQAISALTAQHPDVMVIHNPNVQVYAKALKRAEQAGIYVIQVNMVSNYKTDAYVGANWIEVGQKVGQRVVKACGTGSGTSGEVQIVNGEPTSATAIQQLKGLLPVLAKDPAIKVVSNQAATGWSATKAHDITATVIQQHPNLCASVGLWSVMEAGAAQALKEAGKLKQVKVFASGGEGKADCRYVDSGVIDQLLSYNSPAQARTIIDVASFLLQTRIKPGSVHMAFYSPLHWMEKGHYDRTLCYDWTRKD